MRVICLFTYLMLGCAVLVSCKKETSNPQNSSGSGYTPDCSSAKSFSAQVLPLIQSRCSSCHAQYSNYAQIKASASSIRSTVFNGSMPKGSTLTKEQKDIIVCWVDAGAPEN